MACIIITGAARGGTSLVAGICDAVGIPMGKGGPRFENPYLQWAVLADRWDVVAELVKIIDAQEPLWGWKLPALHKNLHRVSGLLINPRYVFVLKDPVTVARRRADPGDAPHFARMIKRSALTQQAMADFALQTQSPTLFVSYDETMRNMEAGISTIARYCDLDQVDAKLIATKLLNSHRDYINGVKYPRLLSTLDKRLSRICNDAGVFAPLPKSDV
ncbi:MAG: hypothetical protein EON59_01555 [Alphaproteobacteria bacterium]|nr:MAG: hypothetical protein EON59_01555 [Alphaproteobacteria bacterium]